MLLHEAAANANLRATSDAIAERPDDVNLLDEQNRSVLFCAIVGHDLRRPSPACPERNAILKAILSRPELSLYALNAAMSGQLQHAQGATPLILAIRLGRVEQVMILLDCPSVLVNTRDASGLTPLMRRSPLAVLAVLYKRPLYTEFTSLTPNPTDAVHSENSKIVVALLRSGAKVDSLDPLYRSVFEYSKSPKIRIHLENQLRLDRATRINPRTYSPPYANPDALLQLLIRSINNQDVSLLNSTIHSVVDSATPILNTLDTFGNAPIHYAVTCRPPNFAIVDALYAAGADMNLLNSNLKTPLELLVDYPETSDQSLYLLVRHLVQDLQASLLHRDDQMETCLHWAAEHGSCRQLLEALVESDVGGTIREFKNKRSLRPVDVAKTQYRDVFGQRPDSMCTLRPLRSKRSLGSVSSFSSFSSMSTITPPSTPHPSTQEDPQLVGMSLQEALKGSQILLDEIDLSLLQRTLFYRASIDMDAPPPASVVVDHTLTQTSNQVVAYWRSCLSLLREELESTQKALVKSHLLVARTRRDVESKTRDDQRELSEAMRVWEEQSQAQATFSPKEQAAARGRAFTAPARMAETPSDSETSPRFWGANATRVTSFIKQKLRPLSKPPTPRARTPSRSRAATAVAEKPKQLKIRTTDIHSPPRRRTEDESSEVTEIGHYMADLSFDDDSSSPASSTSRIGRSVSTRGTIRKAPVVLTRLHTDLLRMEEYARGIHVLTLDFQREIAKAEQLIHHCLLRACSQAAPTGAEEQEYEDEKELERLRTILLVGLESKVDEMCEALEVVRKWNGLVRSLLRDFRKKVKGATTTTTTMTAAAVGVPELPSWQ